MTTTDVVTRPLHALFAAEMLGADLSEPPSRDLVEAVEAAMDTYAVLAIRGQRIDDTDSSFNDLPTKWSLLLAHVLPPAGGNTEFVDTRAVYDGLSGDMKRKLEGLVVEHFLYNDWSRGGLIDVSDEMRRRMPPARHAIVRELPYGRKALYIGAHASHVVGWPVDEGRALLEELYAFATLPRYVYSHEWRDGDLLIWDNRCTMHRAGSFDSFGHARDLRRTTINEHGPECASTDGLREAAAL